MPDTGFLALFLVGLLGGTHCVGMCGGIVSALSMSGRARWSLHLAYNSGRILSYGVAGAIAGALGGASLGLEGQLPIRFVLYFLANLMLLALGLYLLGINRFLAPVEGLGQRLWRHVQPLGRRFLPARSPGQAFSLGILWGWLPCGLVYSALATALTAGSVGRGALAMLSFGLGTLPNLLLAGIVMGRLQGFSRRRSMRIISGLIVLGFGLYGLFGLLRMIWEK